MEEILPRLKKTIIDGQGNLDLTIVRRSAPAGRSLRELPANVRPNFKSAMTKDAKTRAATIIVIAASPG